MSVFAGLGTVPACPRCGQIMVRRARRRDGVLFWGCPSWPECAEYPYYLGPDEDPGPVFLCLPGVEPQWWNHPGWFQEDV